MGRFVVIVSLAPGAAFGILVLALLWFRSMPAHNQWLTLWIAVRFFLATLVGLTGLASAARRMANVSRAHGVRRGWGTAFALTLVFLSWEATEGGILTDTKTGQPILLYPANLREAVLIAKPDDWKPYDRWLKGFGKAYRQVNGIKPKDELTPEQRRAFWAEARDEWSARLAFLTGPELRQRDLRNADMARAILPRADLRSARLDGTNLREAELQGAELDCWKPSDDERYCTSLQGANLWEAEMQNADCSSATLRGALLQSANVICRNLTQEQLKDAVGDSETVLPDGLTVASCLETLPKDVEAALAHHPEEGGISRLSRAEIRDALLCKKGEKPHATGTPAAN